MGKASLTIAIGGEYNGKALEKAEKALRNFGVEAARHAGGVSQAFATTGDAIVDAGNRMQYIGDKAVDMGTKITKLTAPLAAVGAASVKMAADYQDSVAKVYTIMDDSVMSAEQMSKNILDLSTDTGKAAGELAEATYQALSASVSTEKVAGFVADAVKLSKVGFTETSTAVDTLTTIINAYKYSADDAAMITGRLVQTQNKGKTTVNELSQSIGNVIPTAAAYNVSLDNLCSAYVIMTKQGINTANATTAINGMLTELADEGSTVAGILRDKTGKSFGELMAEGTDLGQVLQIINNHVDGNSEAFANLWGNVRASKGALALANAGAAEFSTAMGDMANSAGLVDDALDKLATPAAKARKALNAVKNTGIELGEEIIGASAPSLESLSARAQELYKWFGDLDEGTKQNIVRFGALAVATGPVITLFGKGMKAVGSFTSSIGHGLQSIGAFSAAMKTAEAEMKAAGASSVGLGAKMKAAAESTGVMTKATGLLRGALSMVGTGAVIALVGIAIEKYNQWKEHTDLVAKATQDLASITGSAQDAYASFSASAEDAAGAVERSSTAAKDCLQAQADLNDEVRSTWVEMGNSAAKVDYYAKVIEELSSKGQLTAEEQFKLADAVENFNSMTGASLAVVNSQTGELNANKDAVLALADAWKREAEAEALKEVYVKYTQQMIEDQMRLEEVTQRLNSANEGLGLWLGDFPVFADEASVAYHDLQQEARDLEAAQKSAAEMAEAAANRIANSSTKYATLGDALDACGVKMEDLGLTTDAQLSALEANFDGTLSSIVRTCIDEGGNIPAGLAQGIDSSFDSPVKAIGSLSDAVIDEAKTKFDSHSPSQVMHKLGQDIDVGLGNGIDASKGKPTSSMASLATSMRNAVSGLPAYARGIGSSSGSGLASSLGAHVGSVSAAAQSLNSSATGGISSAPGAFSATGWSAAGSFSGAIGSSSAYGSGQNLALSTRNGLGSVSAYNTGYNFAAGFSNGMGGVNIWGRAYSLASSALSAMKSALGIASPSKEAAKIGEFFGEGAIVGMRNIEGPLANEVGRLSDIMTLEPTGYGTFAAPWASHQGGNIGGGQTVMNVTVNVYANDAAQGRVAGEGVADGLYQQWRRYQRAL